ncbi:MAG TPA: archease [Nannocystis sp.]
MSSAASHRIEPHHGDLRIALRAPSLAALFEEAARALAEIVAGASAESDAADADDVETITLTAPDREALLVDWLNELIYLTETRHRIYDRPRILQLDDHALTAEVRGRPATIRRSLVKAATFHDLRIREDVGEASATVLLDT